MSYNEIKKHIEKSRNLLGEITSANGVQKRSVPTLTKIAYHLETARDEVQSAITQIKEDSVQNELVERFNSAASGTAELIENGWFHLRLEANLPSAKNIADVKRISKTVTNLLDYYAGCRGSLPEYERVFVAIIEHTDPENAPTYDHDNKGYRSIPNALKGRMFADDDQFTMSLGLFTVENSNDPHCEVYVIPLEDTAAFAAQYLAF